MPGQCGDHRPDAALALYFLPAVSGLANFFAEMVMILVSPERKTPETEIRSSATGRSKFFSYVQIFKKKANMVTLLPPDPPDNAGADTLLIVG